MTTDIRTRRGTTIGRAGSRTRRRAFTLIEMLIVVTIIVSLASMTVMAMGFMREEARRMRTKATIGKINQVILAKYNDYETRRVPLDVSGLTPKQIAEVRLSATRWLQKYEMPDRASDIKADAAAIAVSSYGNAKTMPVPALALLFSGLYTAKQPNTDYVDAKMLYMVCTAGSPEARQIFNNDEIGLVGTQGTPGCDGWPVFIDGWGRPIRFLRWAPSCTAYSDIQSGDATNDHDPFDPLRIHPQAYHLIPLIFSMGSDGLPGVKMGGSILVSNPFDATSYGPLGGVDSASAAGDNITNHRID